MGDMENDNMVKIDVNCEDGYDAKVYEKGDTLRYYLRGPDAVSNPRGEIGMIDLRGRFAGKFKAADNLPSGVGFGFVSEEKAMVTLTTPDGKNLFIGRKAAPMNTQSRIVYGMGCNHAVNYLIQEGRSATMNQTDFISAVLNYADEFIEAYTTHLEE